MSTPPILRCVDWLDLVAELIAHADFRGLARLSPTLASAVLAAPAAIARSIALRAPQLAAHAEITIVVIGAETTDAVDQGRWYQAIPMMLASDAKVQVSLVGNSLDATFASAAAHCAPATAARCMRGALNEYLDANTNARFDVAAVFQPGFQKYRGWLENSGFARLLDAGSLLVGTSYAGDEYQMERWVLDCHGYRASDEPLLNPFYLELGDASSAIRWGGALWQIEAAPPRGFRIDTPRLAALDNLTRMVLHSMTAVGAPSPPHGVSVELSDERGQRKAMIHIFDGRFVDSADGSMVRLTVDGMLAPVGRLPEEELRRYPGAARTAIERAVWAADIKSRFLLTTYPCQANEAEGATVTRTMFETMQSRAVRLFR